MLSAPAHILTGSSAGSGILAGTYDKPIDAGSATKVIVVKTIEREVLVERDFSVKAATLYLHFRLFRINANRPSMDAFGPD